MTEQSELRRQKLEEFLAQNPDDAFSRYGIALDCFRQGEVETADSHFQKLLRSNPDYVPGYQMYAQMLAQYDRVEEAKSVLSKGIESAMRTGKQHALSEMESHLAELG